VNDIFYRFDHILHQVADAILIALDLPPTWKVRSIAFNPGGTARVSLVMPTCSDEHLQTWHSLDPVVTALAEHGVKLALVFP